MRTEESRRRFELYSEQYARFGSEAAAAVRREAYGVDLGQLGWRTLDEQEEIATLVGGYSPCRLVDIACGSGGPSLAIAASTGCDLVGIDVEPHAIEEARQRSAAMALAGRAEFVVADGNERLPFDVATCDVIVCIDAVLHLKDRFSALADWHRLLKPGGALLFTDAGIITGPISGKELQTRASQAASVFVPPGVNEKAITSAGFRLRKTKDTTASLADIAHRLAAARAKRSAALKPEEGDDWFEWRQDFLLATAKLAAEGRLSRFRYVADKPR
jgi:ubiquinone/menaquinone biosynthesis C-methylase UbiE